MKKKYLLSTILIVSLLSISLVLAEDYSIAGSRITNTSMSVEKVSFSSWHSDGRDSVISSLRYNSWSKGLEPQGQGSFVYSFTYGDYKRVINLNLKETHSQRYGVWVYSTNLASGTYWIKGSLPILVKDEIVSYWYMPDRGTFTVFTPYVWVYDINVTTK